MKTARNTRRLASGTGFRLAANSYSEHEDFDGVVDLGEVRDRLRIEDFQITVAGSGRACTALAIENTPRRLSRRVVTAIFGAQLEGAPQLLGAWGVPGHDAGQFVVIAFDEDDRRALHDIASAAAVGRARLVYSGHEHLTIETF